jgi:hypothetical protein
MTRKLLHDNKWHRGFATVPVEVQTDFDRVEMVVNEPVLFKYNENLDAIGAHPYEYAAEGTRKFKGIKDSDISNEYCQMPKGIEPR